MVSRGVERITSRTGRTAEEALDTLKKMSPQNRLVTPEEVAALRLCLLPTKDVESTDKASTSTADPVRFLDPRIIRG
jgi:hypothetical protein